MLRATDRPPRTYVVLVNPSRCCVRHWPISKRAKRLTLTPASSRTALTVFLESCTDGWSSSTTSLKKPLSRPSMILGERLLGLALLAGGRLGDLALLGDDVGGDLVAGEVLRTHRGDLHRGAAGGVLVVTVVLDEHADGRRQVGGAAVHVGRRPGRRSTATRPSSIFSPIVIGELPRRPRRRSCPPSVTALSASASAALASSAASAICCGGGDELVVLGDEVGLGVELDERAAGGGDEAGGGRRARRRAWRPWPRP